MTRAVINIWGDINPALEKISKLIEDCAYSPEANGIAFRVQDMRVVVEDKKIIIYDVRNEARAKAVMEWFINLTNGKVTELQVNPDDEDIKLQKYYTNYKLELEHIKIPDMDK